MNYKKGTQTRGCMKSVMRYVSQLSKTLWDGQQLVSGIGCQPETAFDEFLSTKLLHHKDGGVMFYHMVQSFPKGANVDPRIAHEAARRLAGYFKGCEVLVCTHVDREHIHSHCIINSVNFETGKPRWEIIHGDSLTVLESFPPGTFDAVITDPPYASGGRTQAEKSKATAKKYSSMGGNAPPDFDGDAKDQRSWTRWAAEWLYLARRAAKPGAPVCMFIDWRQLPCASDALQWAGWIWRGIAVWDKGNSRPQKGRFRQQAEYIVWGSNGDMPVSRPVPCLPGVFKYGNPQNRIHLTEKPLQLMQDLVKITEPGGHILDPFAGSGTTVLAAVKEGYDATGIEVTDVYADLARKRLAAELDAA